MLFNEITSVKPEFISIFSVSSMSLSITARQCVKVLAQVGLARPQYIPQILSALRSADLSKYKGSMRPLIERDMEETEKILMNSDLRR